MSRLPTVSGKQLIAALERLGFEVVRQTGLKTDPFLASLHDDPRWTAFLGKLGLAG